MAPGLTKHLLKERQIILDHIHKALSLKFPDLKEPLEKFQAQQEKLPEAKTLLSQILPPGMNQAESLKHHLCFNMFGYAQPLMRHKPKNKNPKEYFSEIADITAKTLNEVMANDCDVLHYVESPENRSFLNVFLKPSHVAKVVPDILSGGLLKPMEKKKERVMIEYSQPNTHKTFHVGHMRNAALGDSLIRFYRQAGYDVTAVNYIGDVGTHIAKCLWYYLNMYPNKSDNIDNDVPEGKQKVEFLGDMYSASCTALSLSTYTKLPFDKYIFAEVKDVKPHPKNDKWLLAQVFDGKDTNQVVCGGKGFAAGDLVAYAPVGSVKSKQVISVIDKMGEQSVGCILSEKELEMGKNNNKIKVFKSDEFGGKIVPGMTLIEGGRIADTDIKPDQDIQQVLKDRDTEVKKLLLAMEEGEEPITALWKKTRQWSLDDFDTIYEWTNSKFDHFFYESDVGTEGKEMVQEAFKEGILVKSNGAIIADLNKYKMPGTKEKMGVLVLLTSAGTGLYATKDLALAKKKFNEYKIDKSIYVVDRGQTRHFVQVFKTLELLGFKQAEQCYHLGYGIVTLKDGKMSSRKGTVVFFSALKNQLSQVIDNKYMQKHRGKWSDEDIETAIKNVSVSAIRYGMLNQDNSKDIIFDLDEWTDPKGNTGPYLMYAYTRTVSILREVPLTAEEKKLADLSLLNHPTEVHLMSLLARFPEVVQEVVDNYRPQAMCMYLYTLCKAYSRMYDKVSVKHAGTPALKASRVLLIEATSQVVKKGLNLLGIKTLERM